MPMAGEQQRIHAGFVGAAMRAPLLSRDREFALARRWREARDETALHELVRCYTRLVVAIAARFRHYGPALADLVQEGNVGLMQAALRFEPDREVRFSTYASWWIRAAIQDFVLRNWSIVRTGTTAAQKSLFFNLRRLRARLGDGGATMTPEARRRIAGELAVSIDEVEQMEIRLGGADVSLNAPFVVGGQAEVQDMLPDLSATPEAAVIGIHDRAARTRSIGRALRALPPRERWIIEQRRLREGGASLQQLGRALGVSKERVRQLESRALARLKAALSGQVETAGDLLPD